MGSSVDAYFAYGYIVTPDDILASLGVPREDDDDLNFDWNAWIEEHGEEDEAIYEVAERIEKKYGLLGLRQGGDCNWGTEERDWLLYVKSTDVQAEYGHEFTRIDPAWMIFDPTHEELAQLNAARTELKITSQPGWTFGWDRG